jgi:ribosomal protein L16/L10AE
MKIRSVVFKFPHADRQTGMAKLLGIFLQLFIANTKDEHQDYAKNALEICAAKFKFGFLLLFGYVCEVPVQSVSL